MNKNIVKQWQLDYDAQGRAFQEEKQTINVCAWAYLGCAIDCVQFASEAGIELDGSIDSLEAFDELILLAHDAYQSGELAESLAQFVQLFAGYAGTVLIQSLGGVWCYAEEGGQAIPVIDFNGNHLNMPGILADCIVQGNSFGELYDWICEHR